MKRIKLFENFSINEDNYLSGHFKSKRLLNNLSENGVTGGNGFEDSAITISNDKFEPVNVYWGSDYWSLEKRMKEVPSDWASIHIYEDKFSYKGKDTEHTVCIITDPKNYEMAAFFVKDENIFRDNDLEYYFKNLRY